MKTVIQQIKDCKHISDVDKEKAINEILKISRSSILRKKVQYSTMSTTLQTKFVWTKAPSDYPFWRKLCNKLDTRN